MKENSYKKKWLKILTIYRNNVYLIQLNDNLYDSCETAGDSSLPNNILIPLNELSKRNDKYIIESGDQIIINIDKNKNNGNLKLLPS